MTSIKKNQIIDSIKFCDENNYFQNLNKIYSTLPKGDCSGCGNCCMESVSINLIEFLNIYKYLMNNENLSKESLKRIIDYYFLELIQKKPCPFRDDNNRCLIYEVRPLNCRLFGHWKKEDYNKNLDRVLGQNEEYKKNLKKNFDVDVNEKVLNFAIDYCEKFKPEIDYLSKETRLNFADEIIILDSKILSSQLIDISYRDRGVVEYFIESLLSQDFAYNVKLRITRENNLKVITRIKNILVR